jgi:flagellin-like protein
MACNRPKVTRKSWRTTRKAVSPVVGEVILIGIVVVLTGSLVYFLAMSQNQNPGFSISVGATVEKTKAGNWTLSITNGKTNAIDTKLQIIDPSSGVAKLSETITTPSGYFFFNDNNQNGAADAGDVILLNQTAGIIEPGLSVELIKADNVIFGPVKIPS